MGEPLLQRLEAARRDTEALGARRVTSRLEYGDPATGIVGIAADEGVDLIVMGTHGRTGVSRWLIGSVAEKVVRSAPCAVLTVKAPVPRTATSRTSRTDSAEPAGH
jgi:nucleotide-binding universal stress UspA family protein